MALNPTALENALLLLFSGAHVFPGETVGRWPASRQEAAEAWAKIYRNYAATAETVPPVLAGVPLPLALAAAEVTLATALESAFAVANDPVSVANGIAAALTAFWLTPPMPFSPAVPPVSVVSAVVGTAALATVLANTWASNLALPPPGVTAATAAHQHALLFDTFTHTVAATSPTVPATNLIT